MARRNRRAIFIDLSDEVADCRLEWAGTVYRAVIKVDDDLFITAACRLDSVHNHMPAFRVLDSRPSNYLEVAWYWAKAERGEKRKTRVGIKDTFKHVGDHPEPCHVGTNPPSLDNPYSPCTWADDDYYRTWDVCEFMERNGRRLGARKARHMSTNR